MKNLIGLFLMVGCTGMVSAQDQEANVYRETLACGDQGCAVTCFQAGDRWQSFLQTAGDIELTYFLSTGVRQIKAPVADGTITVMDTHPNYQTCKITGVKATQPKN